MIKLRTDLATEKNNTYLQIQNGGVSDLSLEDTNQIDFTDMEADDFFPDLTPPMLVSFVVDLTDEELLLGFDEPVSRASLDFTAITLQSTANITQGTSFTLSGGDSNSTNDLFWRIKEILFHHKHPLDVSPFVYSGLYINCIPVGLFA